MTIEEFLSRHKEYIDFVAEGCESVEGLKQFLRQAWLDGYEFRIQEEELNKGASF